MRFWKRKWSRLFFHILLWFLSNLKKKNPSRDCENQTERQAALEGDNEAVNSVCIAHKIQMLEVLTCRMWQNLLWSGDLYFVLVAIYLWCLMLRAHCAQCICLKRPVLFDWLKHEILNFTIDNNNNRILHKPYKNNLINLFEIISTLDDISTLVAKRG